MEPLPVDIFQLQRRDPLAWSALLARCPETSDAIVTAVASESLCDQSPAMPAHLLLSDCSHQVRRYTLTLAGVSDPISFIVKRTSAAEARFYSLYGDPPAQLSQDAITPTSMARRVGSSSTTSPADYPSTDWVPDQVDNMCRDSGSHPCRALEL